MYCRGSGRPGLGLLGSLGTSNRVEQHRRRRGRNCVRTSRQLVFLPVARKRNAQPWSSVREYEMRREAAEVLDP